MDERRATYRVSVKPTSRLSATVCLANRTWKAKAGNVSTEGMFVRLEPEAPVSLEIGTLVVVEITYDGEISKLHGEIRSQRAGGYGIFFPRRCKDGFVNGLDRLEHIWAELQRDDLSKRLFVGSELRDRIKEQG